MKSCNIISMVLAVFVLLFSACKKDNTTPVLSTTASTKDTSTYFTSNEIIALSVTIPVNCTSKNIMEDVMLSGKLGISTIFSINNNRVKGTSHFKTSGLSGLGTISGIKYTASGGTIGSFSGVLQNGQYRESFINNFRITGQSSAISVLIHENGFYTFNAGGTITSDTGSFTSDCQ